MVPVTKTVTKMVQNWPLLALSSHQKGTRDETVLNRKYLELLGSGRPIGRVFFHIKPPIFFTRVRFTGYPGFSPSPKNVLMHNHTNRVVTCEKNYQNLRFFPCVGKPSWRPQIVPCWNKIICWVKKNINDTIWRKPADNFAPLSVSVQQKNFADFWKKRKKNRRCLVHPWMGHFLLIPRYFRWEGGGERRALPSFGPHIQSPASISSWQVDQIPHKSINTRGGSFLQNAFSDPF